VQLLRDVAERQSSIMVRPPALEAVKTWRYLRLAMIFLVVGLATSVLYEHAATADDCWRSSLSAYYYTPVQGVFVGALVTIGICLVSLKGNTDWEDILVNLAGVCAPVVALVPTREGGPCGSVVTGSENRDLNIANNITALLVAGGLALVVMAVLSRLGRWDPHAGQPSRTGLLGFAVTVVLYLATVLVFVLDRSWFTDWGHPIAAIAMFTFIFANVWLNAANLYFARRGTSRPVGVLNPYTVIGVLMAGAVVATVLLGVVGHWPYWKLALEASLITLFAVFWVLQTVELWDQGLRTADAPSGPSAEQAVEAPVPA
jgi:hypothetical protein